MRCRGYRLLTLDSGLYKAAFPRLHRHGLKNFRQPERFRAPGNLDICGPSATMKRGSLPILED